MSWQTSRPVGSRGLRTVYRGGRGALCDVNALAPVSFRGFDERKRFLPSSRVFPWGGGRILLSPVPFFSVGSGGVGGRGPNPLRWGEARTGEAGLSSSEGACGNYKAAGASFHVGCNVPSRLQRDTGSRRGRRGAGGIGRRQTAGRGPLPPLQDARGQVDAPSVRGARQPARGVPQTSPGEPGCPPCTSGLIGMRFPRSGSPTTSPDAPPAPHLHLGPHPEFEEGDSISLSRRCH